MESPARPASPWPPDGPTRVPGADPSAGPGVPSGRLGVPERREADPDHQDHLRSGGNAGEAVAARGGHVEAAQDVHERGLARARRAHDRDVLAAVDRERDAPQRANLLLAHRVRLLDVDRTVLEPDDPRLVHRAADGIKVVSDLRQRRHVVQEKRQRQFGYEMVEKFLQLRLARWNIVRRRDHNGAGARVRGVARERHRLGKRGVRDAHQHGNAVLDLPTNAFDEFLPQAIAQTCSFSRRAQNEQSAHAAAENSFDQPFEAGDIQFVAAAQRSDHGRNNA